jgi:hypothetical protein
MIAAYLLIVPLTVFLFCLVCTCVEAFKVEKDTTQMRIIEKELTTR